MAEVKFRTSNFGIIEHSSGEYEVVEHKKIFDNEKKAEEKIDELYENNQ